ncbi:DUF6912 family protein [Georgenia thermotolerans]|uniref:Uncharacterized protein n=1 Tax=Georgenia thermotolerans TaxID=527326 RepID=A0A7J5UNT8_9MICO|nr:hypothetical protein [Georgenia thermotolerans]KAE8763930.1 hypothetical protein GB883_11515 [Georgenia thermotolerans]
MRVYLPATAADLREERGVGPRWAHAVTAALRGALPDEDDEGLEMTATLAAADESVERLAADGSLPRRVVVAADVPDASVRAPEVLGEEQLETAVEVVAPVPWSAVVAIFVDEPEAADDVAAAAAGNEQALERAAERDLLWYDVVELADLRRELAG